MEINPCVRPGPTKHQKRSPETAPTNEGASPGFSVQRRPPEGPPGSTQQGRGSPDRRPGPSANRPLRSVDLALLAGGSALALLGPIHRSRGDPWADWPSDLWIRAEQVNPLDPWIRRPPLDTCPDRPPGPPQHTCVFNEFLASRRSSILGLWAAPGPPGPP